jgi:hypothetical protein
MNAPPVRYAVHVDYKYGIAMIKVGAAGGVSCMGDDEVDATRLAPAGLNAIAEKPTRFGCKQWPVTTAPKARVTCWVPRLLAAQGLQEQLGRSTLTSPEIAAKAQASIPRMRGHSGPHCKKGCAEEPFEAAKAEGDTHLIPQGTQHGEGEGKSEEVDERPTDVLLLVCPGPDQAEERLLGGRGCLLATCERACRASTHRIRDRNATTASPWFCGEPLSESGEAIPAGASPGLAPFGGCAAHRPPALLWRLDAIERSTAAVAV